MRGHMLASFPSAVFRVPGFLHRLVNKAVLKLSPAIQSVCETRLTEGQVSLAVDAATAELLDELPSETSPNERRFLFNFFATVWSGGDVLEVGPFLGGTSRAIALGMLANPRRRPASKLHTFDRFQKYHGGEALLNFLGPFFDSGKLTAETREKIATTANFREVFDVLHSGQSYSAILETHTGELPERHDQIAPAENSFDLGAHEEFDCVFVDGCKSWFGTKYFMQQVAERTRPGAFYIFQDYAHYSCFWLPAFLGVTSDHFRFYGHVDSTYVFQLTAPLSAATIEERFPDEPNAFDEADFERLFGANVAEAMAAADWRRRVIGRLQHAAALAYVGLEDEARRLMRDELKCVVRRAPHFERVVRGAMKSPTYRSNGDPIVLGN